MNAETLVERPEDLFQQCHMLSKSWENFMFWIIPYLRKLNKYKGHFFDHILYQDHANFYAYNRPNNKSNDM